MPFNVMCSQGHPFHFSSTIWQTYMSSCVDLSGIVRHPHALCNVCVYNDIHVNLQVLLIELMNESLYPEEQVYSVLFSFFLAVLSACIQCYRLDSWQVSDLKVIQLYWNISLSLLPS